MFEKVNFTNYPNKEKIKTELNHLASLYNDIEITMGTNNLVKNSKNEQLIQVKIGIKLVKNQLIVQISVIIYLESLYPLKPPIIIIKPTESRYTMKDWKYKDSSGKIIIPSLIEWNQFTGTMLKLLEEIIQLIQEDFPFELESFHESLPDSKPTKAMDIKAVKEAAQNVVFGVHSRNTYPGGANLSTTPPRQQTTPLSSHPQQSVVFPLAAVGSNSQVSQVGGRPTTTVSPKPPNNPVVQSSAIPPNFSNNLPMQPPSISKMVPNSTVPQIPQPSLGQIIRMTPSQPTGTGLVNVVQKHSQKNVQQIDESVIEKYMEDIKCDNKRRQVQDKYNRILNDFVRYYQSNIEYLEREKNELIQNNQIYQNVMNELNTQTAITKEELNRMVSVNKKLKKVLRKMEKDDKDGINYDEAVDTMAPLYKQLVTLFKEDQSIDDAIFILEHALGTRLINMDVFLKKVRELSRRQFMLRATIEKCKLMVIDNEK